MNWRYQHCGFSPLARQGVAFGPAAAVAPFVSMGLAAASTAATVIGSMSSASAANRQGQLGVQNAQLRGLSMVEQAKLLEANADLTQEDSVEAGAQGQRQAIVDKMKGLVLAGRASAVMGRSGAGFDPKLMANLIGMGNYTAAVDIFNSDERARALMNQSKVQRYNASGLRWSASTGADFATADASAYGQVADSALLGGAVGGATTLAQGALTFAQKYGGNTPTTGTAVSDVDPKIQVQRDVAAESAVA